MIYQVHLALYREDHGLRQEASMSQVQRIIAEYQVLNPEVFIFKSVSDPSSDKPMK